MRLKRKTNDYKKKIVIVIYISGILYEAILGKEDSVRSWDVLSYSAWVSSLLLDQGCTQITMQIDEIGLLVLHQ